MKHGTEFLIWGVDKSGKQISKQKHGFFVKDEHTEETLEKEIESFINGFPNCVRVVVDLALPTKEPIKFPRWFHKVYEDKYNHSIPE